MGKFELYTLPSERARENSLPHVSKPDEIPVFLIPGIFGNSREMTSLAGQLHTIYKDRPIYIYEESDVAPTTLYANSVLAALLAIVPLGRPYPYLLVGYSDGCRLAVNTAKELVANGQDVQVCVLDGTSPSLTHQYFNPPTIESISDIIGVLNYAAELSLFPKMISLKRDEIAKLTNLSVQSTIDHLSILLTEVLNPGMNQSMVDKFLHYADIAKITLHSPAQPTDDSLKVNRIITFFTDETRKKYSFPRYSNGGWERETNNIMLVTDAVLSIINHRQLVTEKYAARLADLVGKHFLTPAISATNLRDRLNTYNNEQCEVYSSKSGGSSKQPTPTGSPELRDSSDQVTSSAVSKTGMYAPRPMSPPSALVERDGRYLGRR